LNKQDIDNLNHVQRKKQSTCQVETKGINIKVRWSQKPLQIARQI